MIAGGCMHTLDEDHPSTIEPFVYCIDSDKRWSIIAQGGCVSVRPIMQPADENVDPRLASFPIQQQSVPMLHRYVQIIALVTYKLVASNQRYHILNQCTNQPINQC